VPRRHPLEAPLLATAKSRLDQLTFYPTSVRLRGVRVLHTPWLFRVPGFRRFRGYEIGPLILVAMPLEQAPAALITHELCHVWQHQHRPVRMWLSYLRGSYRDNPYEIEARSAAGQQR
jgi:hypothetical protein